MVQIDDEKLRELFERYKHLGASQPPLPPEPPLNEGGRGGKSNPMEARVAKLEADVAHLVKQVDRLADVPTKVGELTVKVDNLPTKDWVGQMMRNWVVAAVAFLTLVTVVAKLLPN